jgi:hypothetical protein
MKRLWLRLAIGLGALSYVITVAIYFVPSTWHPSTGTAFTICPACALTVTVDPSFTSVALILAPIDAIVYGAIGLNIGLIAEALRPRSS